MTSSSKSQAKGALWDFLCESVEKVEGSPAPPTLGMPGSAFACRKLQDLLCLNEFSFYPDVGGDVRNCKPKSNARERRGKNTKSEKKKETKRGKGGRLEVMYYDVLVRAVNISYLQLLSFQN
jgi:hypothetical protein